VGKLPRSISTSRQLLYCETNETVAVCDVGPSVAITVTVYVPGTVAGFKATVAIPVADEPA
jgi:hypothetical protein